MKCELLPTTWHMTMSAGNLSGCIKVNGACCQLGCPCKLGAQDLDRDSEENSSKYVPWPVEVVMRDDGEVAPALDRSLLGGASSMRQLACPNSSRFLSTIEQVGTSLEQTGTTQQTGTTKQMGTSPEQPVDFNIGGDKQVNMMLECQTTSGDMQHDEMFNYSSNMFSMDCMVTGMKTLPDYMINSHYLMPDVDKDTLSLQDNGKPLLPLYPCEVCGKSFTQKGFLLNHIGTHSSSRPFQPDKPHVCKVCEKTFMHRSSLRKHLKTHLSVLPHVCPDCGKGFSRKGSLVTHLRTHTGERPYECSQCSKAFTDKPSLNVHSRVHTRERPFSCHICGKTFGYRISHVRHMQAHAGMRPYACDMCGRTFQVKAGLNYHRMMHLGQRPFSCHLCGKTFADKSGLVCHTKTHSDERPYLCDRCGKGFKNKKGVMRHFEGLLTTCKVPKEVVQQRRVHQRKGKRKLRCRLCDKTYLSRNGLVRHAKTHAVSAKSEEKS